MAKQSALSCWAASVLASGCDGVEVFLPDVWQHVLFAQHAALHAFSLATFERMHGRAEIGVATTTNAATSKTDIASFRAMI
jgi:hypothetical protein